MNYFEGTPWWAWAIAAGMSLAGLIAWLAEHGEQFDLSTVTCGTFCKE